MNDPEDSSFPRQIGRYRVERILAKGGFGTVYLAHDEDLQRLMAIQVPHAWLVSRREDAEVYLIEVRKVVSLDHPNIVPVCNVGGSERFPCFVVSKYVEGQDLRALCFSTNPTPIQSARIIAKAAEALDYAHQRDLHHLHLRPNKIVFDSDDQPWLMATDFMRLERLAGDSWVPGNPSYVSPEQVAGASIGSASDIFSLGVVFYEMLTGRRPYRSEGGIELCAEIIAANIEPPSRVAEGISPEFDQICATAMAKAPNARFQRMADFANALRATGA